MTMIESRSVGGCAGLCPAPLTSEAEATDKTEGGHGGTMTPVLT